MPPFLLLAGVGVGAFFLLRPKPVSAAQTAACDPGKVGSNLVGAFVDAGTALMNPGASAQQANSQGNATAFQSLVDVFGNDCTQNAISDEIDRFKNRVSAGAKTAKINLCKRGCETADKTRRVGCTAKFWDKDCHKKAKTALNKCRSNCTRKHA